MIKYKGNRKSLPLMREVPRRGGGREKRQNILSPSQLR